MDEHDENDKRRVMTPPEEWGGDDGADWLMASEENSDAPQPSQRPAIDDSGWLTSESDSAELGTSPDRTETQGSSTDNWFAGGDITTSPEITAPHQADDPGPLTASMSTPPTEPSEEPEAEPAPTSTASDPFGGSNSSEFSSMDLLTDHHIVGTTTTGKLPLWPTIAGIAAVALLLIGGWGAISERSSLQNRIIELEDQQATPAPSNNLDAGDEAVLEAENQALTLQLTTLKGDYSAANDTIQSLQVELENAEKMAAQATRLAEARKSEPLQDQQITQIPQSTPDTSPSAAEVAATDKPTAPRALESSGQGLWFANVTAYSRRETAENWAQKLQSEGYNAITQSVEIGGRTLYRVRAVGFDTKAEAQSTAAELEATYNLEALWIGKSSATSVSNLSSTAQAKPPLDKAMPPATSPIVSDTNAPDNTNQDVGGWFIYVDTYAQGIDADNKAQQIEDAGYAAKVAVEYRSGELLYRVQIVGINSREQGEEIIRALAAGGDMPNLQLRQI